MNALMAVPTSLWGDRVVPLEIEDPVVMKPFAARAVATWASGGVLHIGAAHAGVRQVYRGRGLDAMDLAGVAIEVVIHWCFSLDSLAKLHSRSCTIWFQPVSSGRRRDNWLSCTCRAAVFSTI